MPIFERRSEINAPAAALFDWHMRPGAFERLAPPWEPVELVSSEPLAEGSRAIIRMQLAPGISTKWIAEHSHIIANEQFRDVALSGPFRQWEHTHRMERRDGERSVLVDHIEYQPRLAFLANLVAGRLIRSKLERTFAYRHRVTASDIDFHRRTSGDSVMKIAIGGSTGLVGNELVSFLSTGGHQLARLVRGSKGASGPHQAIAWNPAQGTIDAAGLEGCDAVVHLGGDNIAHGRWTAGKKRLIRDSRVISTQFLAKTLANLSRPPKVFVCASAIGFYGDRGDEVLTEDSAPGSRFLSEVCREWEAATAPARDAGIRVVDLRIGVVLTPKGAALKKMLTPFKLGLGGIVGSGQQWWSWVALDDVCRAIEFAIATDSLSGPVNCVAPECMTNRDFTKTLGRVIRRPTLFPMPAFVVKTIFGEMGEELLLGSSRVVPTRLQQAGFQFACPQLESGLRHMLGR